MGKKIFVSYKHGDDKVHPLNGNNESTARDYVDELIELFEGDEIYKGEDQDLSRLIENTIAEQLKTKLSDSSITIVLISPEMKDDQKGENDQWIPWEISYSLKEITRGGRTSQTNAILAVVLPDREGSYKYYIEDNTCQHCHCRALRIYELFQILKENMFNIKEPTFNNCTNHSQDNPAYTGESSYILSVKWKDFINDKDCYLDRSTKIRDNREKYNIVKEIPNE